MKKVLLPILCFIVCLLPMSFIGAKDSNKNCYFDGELTPKTSFYQGDFLDINDFTINGTLYYNGVECKKSNIAIVGFTTVSKYALGKTKMTIKLYIDNTISSLSNDRYATVDVTVNILKLKDGLSSNISKKILTKKDLKINNVNNFYYIDQAMKNKLGKVVVGDTLFKVNNDSRFYSNVNVNGLFKGYNEVNYTFCPYNTNYKAFSSTFYLFDSNLTDIFDVSKTVIKFKNLNNLISEARVNNEDWMSLYTIDNLTPSTSYKLQIRQLVNDEYKIIYTGTVTTKSN